MTLPTDFLVTRTITCPIQNPASPLPLPREIETLDIRGASRPTFVSPLGIEDVSAPLARTALPIAGVNIPSLINAATAADVGAPVSRVTIPQPDTPVPVLPTVMASVVIGVPTTRVRLSQPDAPAPTLPTVMASEEVGTPTSRTVVAQPDTPAPVTIAPNSGTQTEPPFPLNHARILYDNLLVGSSVVANGGNGVANTLIPNTFQRWSFTANTSTASQIAFTLPANADIDTVCIAGHNISGATVRAIYSATDSSSFIPLAPDITATDNAIMIHAPAAVSARRIQVNISGLTGSRVVAYISAGIALQMQRPFFSGHNPITDATVSQFYTSYTETFALIAKQRRRVGQRTTAEWKNLDDTWYRTRFEPVKEQLEAEPYFFAWNLLQFPNDVGFVQTEADIRAPYNGVNELRNLSIPMRGTR